MQTQVNLTPSKQMQVSMVGQESSYNHIQQSVTTDHPVAFVSGLFRGSQLNWTAMMKETYTIYMSVYRNKMLP